MPPSEPILAKPYKAPAVRGTLGDGSSYPPRSKASAGAKPVWRVLYFYPKDMTSGCTRQAEDFQAQSKTFAKLGAEVIGVSRDSCARHQSFSEKHGLTFALIADEDGALCQAYGVWKEKKLYGRAYMGIERSTFVLDPKGLVVAEWRGVKVPGHVDEVLAALRDLMDR
jgi:peroxiredoxin Q/BCP